MKWRWQTNKLLMRSIIKKIKIRNIDWKKVKQLLIIPQSNYWHQNYWNKLICSINNKFYWNKSYKVECIQTTCRKISVKYKKMTVKTYWLIQSLKLWLGTCMRFTVWKAIFYKKLTTIKIFTEICWKWIKHHLKKITVLKNKTKSIFHQKSKNLPKQLKNTTTQTLISYPLLVRYSKRSNNTHTETSHKKIKK